MPNTNKGSKHLHSSLPHNNHYNDLNNTSKSERDLERFYHTVNSIISNSSNNRFKNMTTKLSEKLNKTSDSVNNIIGLALQRK